MSRHRSPTGRHAHPRYAVATAPARAEARRPKAAHAAPAARLALRNGLVAAATTGGALALAAPLQALTADAEGSALRFLTASEQAAAVALPTAPSEEVRLIGQIVPVDATADSSPPPFDLHELIKAAGLADVARKAAEQRAAREAVMHCDMSLRGLGQVKPWVAEAARFLSCQFGHPRLIGVASRGRASDHPSGHALDVMVRGVRGDRIAECVLRNQRELGVTYVIWKQRINYGDGWQLMADRGGETENHFDHVHISFSRTPPRGIPTIAHCR